MFLRFNSYDLVKPMSLILEEDPAQGLGQLWLGDYTAAMDQATLKSKGIKTVLTVASGLSIFYSQSSNIVHKSYNILDIESANISRIWSDTYIQISEGLQRGNVLVHCAAGVSRSASTVIAFLMRKQQWGFSETFNFVKKRRSIICPNIGFQRQLRQFEKELAQENKQTIKLPLQWQSKLDGEDDQQSKILAQLRQAWNSVPEDKQQMNVTRNGFEKQKNSVFNSYQLRQKTQKPNMGIKQEVPLYRSALFNSKNIILPTKPIFKDLKKEEIKSIGRNSSQQPKRNQQFIIKPAVNSRIQRQQQ